MIILSLWKGEIILSGPRGPTIREVATRVAGVHGVSVAAITDKADSTRPMTRIRHKAMCECRHGTSKTLGQIGQFFNRDHAEVARACRLIHGAGLIPSPQKSGDTTLYPQHNGFEQDYRPQEHTQDKDR